MMAEDSVHSRTTPVALLVNGECYEIMASPSSTLLEVLREDLDLTGTKHGCELGECGACTVLLDGEPTLSCLLLAVECAGHAITTIEGVAGDGELLPLQHALAELGGSQCGYCTPGIVLAAKALLDREPHPERRRICQALAGNLCRCTGYQAIVDAVVTAANREASS